MRGTSTYPAEERARRITERIEEVARTAGIAPEAVQAAPADEVVNVTAGDRFLVMVTEADARLEALDRRLLSTVYVERIRGGIRAYRQAREPQVLLRGARRAAAATVLLLVAILALRWAFRRLEALFGRRYEEKIHSVQIQSFEILRGQHLRRAFRAGLRVLRAVTAAVLLYFWLQFVLGSFPLTRPLAARLLALVLDPLSRLGSGLLAVLPDLAFLLVLYVITRWLLGLVHLFFEAVAGGRVTLSGFEPEWALPTYRILRMAVVAFALVVAYPYIPGSRSAAFQSISIFLGVMFSIGSSSFIANIIAGYSMTYRRAFRLGDRIQVGEVFGDVSEIRLQVTHVRSVKNEEIVVPNSSLLNSNVVNYSALARTRGLILHTTVGIGYETPWRQVEGDAAPGRGAHGGAPPRARAVRAPEVARRLLRRVRDQRVLQRPGGDGEALHAPPPEHPGRLQRVRRPDHDPSLRGRPRAAQGGAKGAVVDRSGRASSAGGWRIEVGTRFLLSRWRLQAGVRPDDHEPARSSRRNGSCFALAGVRSSSTRKRARCRSSSGSR